MSDQRIRIETPISVEIVVDHDPTLCGAACPFWYSEWVSETKSRAMCQLFGWLRWTKGVDGWLGPNVHLDSKRHKKCREARELRRRSRLLADGLRAELATQTGLKLEQ